jgi:hypothetical protein
LLGRLLDDAVAKMLADLLHAAVLRHLDALPPNSSLATWPIRASDSASQPPEFAGLRPSTSEETNELLWFAADPALIWEWRPGCTSNARRQSHARSQTGSVGRFVGDQLHLRHADAGPFRH